MRRLPQCVVLAPALVTEDSLQLVPVGDTVMVGDGRAEAVDECAKSFRAKASGCEAQYLNLTTMVLELDHALVVEDVNVLQLLEAFLSPDCTPVDLMIKLLA
mmetsp:Transcript_117583/g.327463  ORF Transcript_117583/g.327463 Transcript_117583/m.327463 type:complete len:102 (+) Transcript_117583:915-1220(+)